MLYHLTMWVNDYSQHGTYTLAIFDGKPTVNQLQGFLAGEGCYSGFQELHKTGTHRDGDKHFDLDPIQPLLAE